ncbi:MAG TPA: NlpC/P60 family protein [Candidatus Paceibacterota bacterium]|nr:NlpC/P60 family protein [Candidatus Paceibacterota bacterium]
MELLTKKNYINAIKKSIGVEMFQSIFAEKDGHETDITRKGQLSCALFVSSILKLFNLIDINKAPHSTVLSTLKNMEASGWKKVSENELEEGDVIVWEKIIDVDGEEHEHIGFFIGNERAVSNSSEKRVPAEHHYTYDGKRGIISAWRAPNL